MIWYYIINSHVDIKSVWQITIIWEDQRSKIKSVYKKYIVGWNSYIWTKRWELSFDLSPLLVIYNSRLWYSFLLLHDRLGLLRHILSWFWWDPWWLNCGKFTVLMSTCFDGMPNVSCQIDLNIHFFFNMIDELIKVDEVCVKKVTFVYKL